MTMKDVLVKTPCRKIGDHDPPILAAREDEIEARYGRLTDDHDEGECGDVQAAYFRIVGREAAEIDEEAGADGREDAEVDDSSTERPETRRRCGRPGCKRTSEELGHGQAAGLRKRVETQPETLMATRTTVHDHFPPAGD